MILRSVARETFVIVPPIALVGRDPTSAVVLLSDQASAAHAELRWRSGGWDLRDKGSRNGSAVDGKRLLGGVPVSVWAGSMLQFGDRSEFWHVVDADAPASCLFHPITGAVERPKGEVLGPLKLDLSARWCLDGLPLTHGAALGERCLFDPPPGGSVTTAPARIALSLARVRIVTTADLAAIDIHVEQGAERSRLPSGPGPSRCSCSLRPAWPNPTTGGWRSSESRGGQAWTGRCSTST